MIFVANFVANFFERGHPAIHSVFDEVSDKVRDQGMGALPPGRPTCCRQGDHARPGRRWTRPRVQPRACPCASACLAVVLLVLLTGCTGPGQPSPTAARPGAYTGVGEAETSAARLAELLRNLESTVDPAEARLAAATACAHSLELARAYRVVRPQALHNILVNVGLRSRGLCFHWAEDLTARLERLHLRTLEIHRGVARMGTLREHSCVVLTAVGQAFEEGVILDAWRHSGQLHASPLKQDKYPWIRVEVGSPHVSPSP